MLVVVVEITAENSVQYSMGNWLKSITLQHMYMMHGRTRTSIYMHHNHVAFVFCVCD